MIAELSKNKCGKIKLFLRAMEYLIIVVENMRRIL